MNLNNDKNILLAKKAVYAEQLNYYSKLCQAYQGLAEEARHSKNMTAADIEKRYAKPLSMIIDSEDLKQTLQYLSDEYVFPSKDDSSIGLYMGSKYSKSELGFFTDFARAAKTFKTFQIASDKLDDISSAEDIDRESAISDFHTYMQSSHRPKSVQNFDSLLSAHSPRYLGSRFFLVANQALSNIQQIDQSHIPLDPFVISDSLTPENFGAMISGYKTIASKIEDLETDQSHTRHYDPENWDLNNTSTRKINEARDEFDSTKGSISEKAYVAGSSIKNKASKVYSAHKGTAKKALLLAAAVATIIGGAHQVKKEVTAHNLDINSSTQYEQTINDETKNYINNIIQKLNLQNNSFDPQYQDVKDIEGNIDLVLDYIVRDQVTTAFENYHDGYTVTDVSSWFDKRYQSAGNEPSSYQFIDVSYIDANGKEGMERISDFRSETLTKNHLQDIFTLEENIDLNSPVWSAFNNDGTKNFLQQAQSIDDVLQYLRDATTIVKNAAAFNVEHGHSAIFGDPYLKSTLPEKTDDEER